MSGPLFVVVELRRSIVFVGDEIGRFVVVRRPSPREVAAIGDAVRRDAENEAVALGLGLADLNLATFAAIHPDDRDLIECAIAARLAEVIDAAR